MTEPSERPEEQPPTAGDLDPTRDIRLPNLPGRQAPVLPASWAKSTEELAKELPPPVRPVPFWVDPPTDQLAAPPNAAGDRTLDLPPQAAVPVGAGTAGAPAPGEGDRRRWWPWLVLTLLPVVVIVVAGVWWLLLARGA